MDRSIRRRRLGILAIVVAALASAGTSASPPPTPALSSSQQGTLTVTADEPVAWIDVAADEDANLLAAQGQTAVRVDASAADLGVFLIADDLAAPDGRYAQLGAVNRIASCPVGAPCGATIRLTAILVDPMGHPSVDVQYTATAETRFSSSSGPVPTAAIDVVVSDVTSMAAEDVGISTTQPEEIHLGPDVPRAVRTIHVSLPAGLPTDATLVPNALVLTTDLDGDPGYAPNITVRRVTDGQAADIPSYAPLLYSFADCIVGAPCEVDVELRFDWNGGPAEGWSIEWSLAAWPGMSGDEPAEAATIDPPVATDVSWAGPLLTSSLGGRALVPRNGGANVSLNAALDLSDVPQAVGAVEGLARLTLQATLAPGTDPAATVRLATNGSDDVTLTAGETVTIYSMASDVSCGGRSVCPTPPFSIGLNPGSTDVPDATVDWTAEVEFLPLGTSELPDGATIDLVVPSPPP